MKKNQAASGFPMEKIICDVLFPGVCIFAPVMEYAASAMFLLTAWVAVLLLVLLAGVLSLLAGPYFRTVFRYGMWLMLIPPVAFAYGTLIERNIYHVNEVAVESADIPASFDGYRIVHISDLHLASFAWRPGSLEKAVRKINSLQPDAVMFTGDLITLKPSELDGLEEILSGIRAADGVFAVRGNHDYCAYGYRDNDSLRNAAAAGLVMRERAMGWNVLMNSNVNIMRGSDTLSVLGVENTSPSGHFPSYGTLDRAKEGAGGQFRILLSHDPHHWHYEVAFDPTVDLTLSGHTHSMQLSLFGWSPSSLLYEEYSGLYGGPGKGPEGNVNHLYVNTGLGETGLPARIGVPPEITLITLEYKR